MRVGRAASPPHPPSLRAQRRNPESFRSDSLDCFVARAPRNDDVDRACAILSSRAPDAAQRPFDGALQSRGPCCCVVLWPWVPPQRSTRCSLSWTRESCIAALELATRRRRLAPANYSAIPPAAPVDLPATIRFNGANLSFPGDSDGAMTWETQRGASASRRAAARHAGAAFSAGPAIAGDGPRHLRETVGNALCLSVIRGATGPDPER